MINVPHNKKLVYERIDISILIASTAFAASKKLREGELVGARLIDFSSATARAHAINVGVQDSKGSDVISQTDFRDFTHAGGGYLDGFKPASFDTRSQVNIVVTSSQAIANADFKAQLIFAVLIDK